ncbi:conserved hypothetical protein [Psychromonas ingrahamii 37]|uniref:DUF3010 domain-containing protein n=1 Tax=Psychromonas ingrahamii (strain DSM 17664 / CCUG 51855 / 37) TaxID=357804 RepID=A1SVH1_PSYIN|nr:DUF3010 family protein [Psychromonas ingrahamii]ABM03486.1 conserved hypothetical protein [Psychromonas ingrahamii 37]
MPKVCGIELKGSEAILAIIDADGNGQQYINIEPRKIKIGDDESTNAVLSFYESFKSYVTNNHIEVVVVKKRKKNGSMSGGGVSFKLEALIQLNGTAEVVFVSGQGIAASHKKDNFELPEGINKYQEAAFMSACLYLRKNKGALYL